MDERRKNLEARGLAGRPWYMFRLETKKAGAGGVAVGMERGKPFRVPRPGGNLLPGAVWGQ